MQLSRNAAMCDADGCDTFTRAPEEFNFMQLTWGDTIKLFCSGDCAMRWLADNTTPLVVIDNE